MATLAEVLGNEYFKLCTQRFIICICGDFDSFYCKPGRFVELPDCNWYNYDDESDIYELFEEDEDLKDLIPWLDREVEELDSAIDWSEVVAVRDTSYEGRDRGVYAPVLKIALEGELEDEDEKILNNTKLVCKKNCYMPPERKNWPFTKDGDDFYWPYSLNHAKYEKLKDIFTNVPLYGQHSILRHALCLILKDGREKIANMSDEDATELVNYLVEREKRPENSTPFFATTGEEEFRSFVTDTIDIARKVVDVLNTRDILEFLLINPIISSSNRY